MTRQARRPSLSDAKRAIEEIGHSVGKRNSATLRELTALEDELRLAWITAIDGLRESHSADGDIGKALGISRQTVITRWPANEPRAVGAKAWRG